MRRPLALLVCLGTLVGCFRGGLLPKDPGPNNTGTPGAPDVVTVSARLDSSDLTSSHFTVDWTPVPDQNAYTIYYAADAAVTPDNFSSLPDGGSLTGATAPATVVVPGFAEMHFVVGVDDGSQAPPYSAAVAARGVPTGSQGLVPLNTPAWEEINGTGGYDFGHPLFLMDVNGDGFDDLMTADHRWDDTVSVNVGQVHIFRGGADGLATTAQVFSAPVPEAGEAFGFIGPAGNINNDAFPDFIVGAPDFNTQQGTEGRAFLFLGGTSLGDPATTPGATWRREAGAAAEEFFGRFSGNVGDINGDNFDDWVVSRHLYNVGITGGGRISIYSGSDQMIGSIDPALEITSNNAGAELGWALASWPGNPDGDDDQDLLVAERYGGLNDEGEAYLYLVDSGAIVQPAAWSMQGNTNDICFGHALAWAGDVDDDGLEDAIIGAPGCGLLGATVNGRVDIYRGTAGGGGLELTPAWSLDGVGLEGLGEAVEGIGDINGDGVADFAIGSRSYDPGGLPDAGRVQLFLGEPLGTPALAPQWQAVGDVLDGHRGGAIGGRGDVNGDGSPDIAIGTTGFNLVLNTGEHTNVSVRLFYGPPRATPEFDLATGPLTQSASVALELEVSEPGSFPATGTFHTCTVDWGDASAPEDVPCAPSGGEIGLSPTHDYAAAGEYTVRVRVSNAYGNPGLFTEAVLRLRVE